MEILSPEEARLHVAEKDSEGNPRPDSIIDQNAEAIADATAAHAQWRDSRPYHETAPLEGSAVVHPPDGPAPDPASDVPSQEPIPSASPEGLTDDELRNEMTRRGWGL